MAYGAYPVLVGVGDEGPPGLKVEQDGKLQTGHDSGRLDGRLDHLFLVFIEKFERTFDSGVGDLFLLRRRIGNVLVVVEDNPKPVLGIAQTKLVRGDISVY